MFKKKSIRKIVITSALLFHFFLFSYYTNQKIEPVKTLEYVSDTHFIYAKDSNGFLSRIKVDIKDSKKEELAYQLLEKLKMDEIKEGFYGVIPKETEILSLKIKEDTIYVDFTSSYLKGENVIEATVYTLTEIKGISYVSIFVEGKNISEILNTKEKLNREIGINKEYHLTSYKDTNNVTIYYIGRYEDEYYYIPVTKYVNDNNEKIKIIIEELTSSSTTSSNLMSFLNSNVKLLSTKEEVSELFLTFNEYIFSDMDSKYILEEVISSICLSILDTYNVDAVSFYVGDEQIYKSVLKTLE